MELTPEFEIGIVDYRNIIKVIKDTYNYDFSEFALTSLKRRFEKILQIHNLKQTDLFINKLREDKLFFDKVLHEVAVESTEMFRDPSFWRFLRDELLPLLLKENSKIKIWFPSCTSGGELYTCGIVLKESNWLDKVDVIASCYNSNMIASIESGYYKTSKIEASSDNYDRFQGKVTFNEYYTSNGEYVTRDTSLIKNVHFIKQNTNFDNSPQDVKLIICRNQLIYFTQTLHDKILKLFNDNLMPGGYLVLGVKEQVGMISSKYYRLINESESIYKKI